MVRWKIQYDLVLLYCSIYEMFLGEEKKYTFASHQSKCKSTVETNRKNDRRSEITIVRDNNPWE